MSVSGRLKALVEGYFEDTEPSGWEAPEEVIRALPELIAVVEAAANAHAVYSVSGQCEATTQQSLRAALIVLDDALTTEEKQ